MSDDAARILKEFTEACVALDDGQLRDAMTEYEYHHPGTLTNLRALIVGERSDDLDAFGGPLIERGPCYTAAGCNTSADCVWPACRPWGEMDPGELLAAAQCTAEQLNATLRECDRLRAGLERARPVFAAAKTWARWYDHGRCGLLGSVKRSRYSLAVDALATAVDEAGEL